MTLSISTLWNKLRFFAKHFHCLQSVIMMSVVAPNKNNNELKILRIRNVQIT